MKKSMKIKVDFESETSKSILNFISDTQNGKYTVEKPDLSQIAYKYVQIPAQENINSVTESNNEIKLFGII